MDINLPSLLPTRVTPGHRRQDQELLAHGQKGLDESLTNADICETHLESVWTHRLCAPVRDPDTAGGGGGA